MTDGTYEIVDRFEALDEASRAIAGVLDLDTVLQLIVDRVRVLVDADYAALGIVDATGGIERFITSGISTEARARIGEPPRGHGLLGLIIRENRPYRIPDIGAHRDSYGFPPNHPPMTSFLGVPVVVRGRSIGNLYLTDKRGAPEFDEADERLVGSFARHAAIAIDNARLHEQVQRLAVVEERDRIGRDLHDGIIQGLYAISLSLEDVEELMATRPDEAVARIERAIDGIHLAIGDIRNFILGLRPHLLEQADLVDGLDALADEIRFNTLIDVEVEVDDHDGSVAALDDETRSHLLQVAREALSNLARHSGASRAVIALAVDREGVRLTIADNGIGFDAAIDPGARHQGLANMRGRAAAVGGRLEVISAPMVGTRIIVAVPSHAGERPT